MKESEITDENLYHERRKFIKTAASISVFSFAPTLSILPTIGLTKFDFDSIKKSNYSTNEELTPFDAVSGYNMYPVISC